MEPSSRNPSSKQGKSDRFSSLNAAETESSTSTYIIDVNKRQQRRDLRRLNRILKNSAQRPVTDTAISPPSNPSSLRNVSLGSDKKRTNKPNETPKTGAAVVPTEKATNSSASGVNFGVSTSSSSVAGPSRPLRIIKNKNNNQSERSSGSGLTKKERKSLSRNKNKKSDGDGQKKPNKTEINELGRYLGLALNNLRGHMHDQIIATLPTEMSLYYQKLHDTLLMDPNTTNANHQQSRIFNKDDNSNAQMNEMHEFIPSPNVQPTQDSTTNIEQQQRPVASSSSSVFADNLVTDIPHTSKNANFIYNAGGPPVYNPYAPPPSKPGIMPIRDFLKDPLNASISTLNRVTKTGQNIYNQGYSILNTFTSPVALNEPYSRRPGMAERVVIKNGNDRDFPTTTIPLPPPVLPLIQCTQPQTRLEPLSVEEFEQTPFTVEQLRQRVFKGGLCDELRLRLWPFILGLHDNGNADDDFDVRLVKFDWSSKETLFEHYRSQWKAILPEQEKRFMLFRERKSLIERDVIRCDRTHPFYLGDDNENLEKLKELLLTYMMYDFDTGYVQGMSDLASPLLYVAKGDTCKAFWFFVKIMDFTNDNFEMSQLTIKLQFEMLWKLIELTDPIFAQYLANNDSVNCYFAFRWIVCQFKREFMKTNSDGYQEILLLWESIWTCSSMKRYYQKLKQQEADKETVEAKSDGKENPITQGFNVDDKISEIKPDRIEKEQDENLAKKLDNQCKIVDSSVETTASTVSNQPSTSNSCGDQMESSIPFYGLNPKRPSDTELYVLCICLAIIRRERDLIMAQRFDATEILKHFNTLHLTNNLKNILIHASNIWSWLIYDGNEKLLYNDQQPNSSDDDDDDDDANAEAKAKANANNNDDDGGGGGDGGNTNSCGNNPSTSNHHNQSIDTEEFDLLQDLRFVTDRQISPGEDYFLFNND